MFETIVNTIYNVIWSPAMIILLLGAGLYFSIRTRFVQIRRIGHMGRLLFNNPLGVKNEPRGITSFQAFCIALSGKVGTGNIVGVATAIAIGGPGSIFWMWVVALLGASTAFVEATMAQTYRFSHNGTKRGGPFCYIEQGLGKRKLAVLFAILSIVGYGILLVGVQANGVSSAMSNSFGLNPWITAVACAVLLVLVVVGGVKRIAQVAEYLTPFMGLTYILMAIVILTVNYKTIPGVFQSIFTQAFGIGPAGAGMLGSAISMGVKRGLFSNEAGQGGGAFVSAAANVQHPAQQGLVQAFSVYFDTLLVCTSTALMILCTGCYNILDPNTKGMLIANAPQLGNNYVGYTQAAIDSVFHGIGSGFVASALALFVFTTLVAYYFYAESSLVFLFKDSGKKATENFCIWTFRVLMVAMILFGSLKNADVMWTIGDIGVGLTAWVNIIVLLILCPKAIASLKEYESTLKKK